MAFFGSFFAWPFHYCATQPCYVVLGLVILSGHLCHVCHDKTKQCTAGILIPRKRAITLVFLTPTVVGGRCPFHLKSALFSKNAHSTVRDSQKSSIIMTNRKLTTGFPMSYTWSAYVTPKSPIAWLKKWFLVCLKKFNFNQIKFRYQVFCVKLPVTKL